MNWMPELFRIANLHGGDINHPEVIAWANKQWEESQDWRYELDDQTRFSSQSELAATLHIGKVRLARLITEGGDLFQFNGHKVRVNIDYLFEHVEKNAVGKPA
jgi:hypothetical protein